jgi:hypothetical protein
MKILWRIGLILVIVTLWSANAFDSLGPLFGP